MDLRIVLLKKFNTNVFEIRQAVNRLSPENDKGIIYTEYGSAVLELVKDGKPTLIVSGQVLPDYPGDGLAEKIKRINPNVAFFIVSVFPPMSNNAVDGIIRQPIGTRDPGIVPFILTADYTGMTIPQVITHVQEVLAASSNTTH